MFDLSSVLSGLGQGKGYGSAIGKMASAIPSMDSAANPSALDTLFGSLSQFGANPEDESNQGFGDGSNLAAGAQAQAAKSMQNPMGGMQRAPVNMQNLMQMLANSGRLGTPALRNVAQMRMPGRL